MRALDREEHIDLVYFGGLRTGTDVAKILAINCRAGVFGAAMAFALGGDRLGRRFVFDSQNAHADLGRAGLNWLAASAQETAMIARSVGKTNVHNMEPEDLRCITLATAEAIGVPLAAS
ncbi:MAG: hypothetical protein M1274_04460 [Actinobacteria bacterium]|nr:hypothetical protein [Actinomycetota bacterium]